MKFNLILVIAVITVFNSISFAQAQVDSTAARVPAVKTTRRIKSTQDIAGAVNKPSMKKLWADAENKTPPLDMVPEPTKPVTARKFYQIAQVTRETPVRPTIDKKASAEVRVYSKKPVMEYQGTFTLTSHMQGKLVGRLKDHKSPMEIMYQLPRGSSELDLSDSATLGFTLVDKVSGMSLQRRVILTGKEKGIKLAQIEEGSEKLFDKSYPECDLTVTQMEPDGEGSAPVKIMISESADTLREGESKKIGERTVFLITSVATPKDRLLLIEGQPFYIKLVVY